ncbi:hypothetical protein K466DRAFT_664217 [Polyporus arcularius HHB13444]|uniref:Uncharacterized protein n=1 Tax=Polyporus arcularius HHB13444 TaxID=1314778 RepID=A0A5C3P987_9APHY|nr:hypothetical protein K466DRAFT_664217 [Polyporus arcularius HHB13444]
MANIIPILTVILTGGELLVKIKEVAEKLIPDVPKELKDKFRYIQARTHFDNGKYWDAPGGTGPFTQLVFTGCNQDLEPGGVAGGTAFRLSLDAEHYYDFALGWTHPSVGALKASVVEGTQKAKDAYEAATPEGNALVSTFVFEGKDKDNNKAQFKIHISATPGVQSLYVLKQVEVGKDAV